MTVDQKNLFRRIGKSAFYIGSIGVLCLGFCYANLDEQVTKVGDMINGKIASLVVGGGLALGGSHSIYTGNLMKGFGQLGVAALIGIGVALSKSSAIFNVLN